MPIELFDLTYSKEEIIYRGIPVKCQTKEYTYLSKSIGTREKDKLDANVLKRYIGEDEEKRIARIKKLQKRVEEYRVVYDKDGNIVSSRKKPTIEEKIEQFIFEVIIQNKGKSNEELKSIVLNNKFVKDIMKQDEDIRNIMKLWQTTQIDGNLAECAKIIAHNYFYIDEQSEKKSWKLNPEEVSKIQRDTAEIANEYVQNHHQEMSNNEKEIS